MLRKISLFVLSVAIIFSLAHGVHAQMVPTDDITINLTPENPGPNQKVTISVQSYSIDTKAASIEWFVNGSIASKGIGDDSYTFTTKALGTPMSIEVDVIPNGGIPVTKKVVITPLVVDLLWQTTDSIVPPFYRGKALPTSESQIKVVAIPQILSGAGTVVAASNFLYTWQEQFQDDAKDSGYGKDSLAVSMDYLNPINHVAVTVSSLDGATSVPGEMSVSPVSPAVLFYASNPLYGPIFDYALSSPYTVVGSQNSLFAEPYFFSLPPNGAITTTYEWALNGRTINTPGVPNVLGLQRDASQTGSATVDLTVVNAAKLLQQATAHLDLTLQ